MIQTSRFTTKLLLWNIPCKTQRITRDMKSDRKHRKHKYIGDQLLKIIIKYKCFETITTNKNKINYIINKK